MSYPVRGRKILPYKLSIDKAMQRVIDNCTEPAITESDSSNGSRKRERGSCEEEATEHRPSKKRHSEEEATRLEEAEVQTLLDPREDTIEPLPEISLILRSGE